MYEEYGNIPNVDDVVNVTNWNVLPTNDYNVTHWDVRPKEYRYNDVPLFLVFIYVIVGTTGNCLVILAILLNRNLKNQSNYLHLSLAVADLLICTLSFPGRIILYPLVVGPSLFPLCYLELFFIEFTYFSSVVHMAVISVDTYFAIKNPPNEKEKTKKGGIIKIALPWLIACITALPFLIPISLAISAGQMNQADSETCLKVMYEMPLFNIIFLTEALVLSSVLSVISVTLILITILLYKLAKRQKENSALLRAVSCKNNESNDKKISETLNSEQKELMTVWLLSVTVLICTIPHACIFAIATTGIYHFPIAVLKLESCLIFANNCIHPFIYPIFNQTFRDSFKNILLFRYKKVMT